MSRADSLLLYHQFRFCHFQCSCLNLFPARRTIVVYFLFGTIPRAILVHPCSGVSRISARGVLKVRPHTKSGGGGQSTSGPIYEKWGGGGQSTSGPIYEKWGGGGAVHFSPIYEKWGGGGGGGGGGQSTSGPIYEKWGGPSKKFLGKSCPRYPRSCILGQEVSKNLARSYSCQEINAASWLQSQECKK